jgi:hypothetical protein
MPSDIVCLLLKFEGVAHEVDDCPLTEIPHAWSPPSSIPSTFLLLLLLLLASAHCGSRHHHHHHHQSYRLAAAQSLGSLRWRKG